MQSESSNSPELEPDATIEEIVAATGLSVGGARDRLARFPHDRERLLAPRMAKARSGSPIFVKYGDRKLTIRDWALERRMPREKLRARLKRPGWSIGQALGLEPPPSRVPRQKKSVRVKTAATVEEIMAASGIGEQGAKARLAKSPRDRDRLLRTRIGGSVTVTSAPALLEWEGRKQKVSAWAIELGIPPETIRVRIRSRGWSVGQALGMEPPPPKKITKDRNRKITVGDRTLTATQWANETGVSKSTILDRLKEGFAPADAVAKREPPMVLAFGIKKKLIDWERATGIKRTTIVMRINHCGWTPEEALELVPRKGKLPRTQSPQVDREAQSQLIRELAERGISHGVLPAHHGEARETGKNERARASGQRPPAQLNSQAIVQMFQSVTRNPIAASPSKVAGDAATERGARRPKLK